MSLPPELRVLCFQLSNTPTSDLPRLTPTLLRYVSRCQAALSVPAGNISKGENPASSVQVQVHKLKTQLSTLLNGKSPEGRFTAVVLIKAVVEAGGWEILRGSESWVRGLLSVLGKPDSAATKELCIIALTKIYCMTHPYQTLVREITTPTLPAFVTACLGLLVSKSKVQDISMSTVDMVFRSFATLLPRHTTVFRPFVSQIRSAAKPYIASTLCDRLFIPSSLSKIARRLIVLLHQTVAKNAGGEDWAKAVLNLMKEIHVTADLIFRAVVEDWESAVGYIGEPIDVNVGLSGGARTLDDLPQWIGINAGVERMIGLLQLLNEYLSTETSLPVSIPLGVILDVITRTLSIAIPSPSQSSTGRESVRLHPAIDRDERDELWSGMPQIYVAALEVVGTMAKRLQDAFMPMAQGLLDQLAWVFPYGKHDSDFRRHTYCLIRMLLPHTGRSLGKASSSKLAIIIRSCCNDLIPVHTRSVKSGADVEAAKKSNGSAPNTNQNADLFLQNATGVLPEVIMSETDLNFAAKDLLPLFLSQFPQQYLDISLRSLIDRTAILSHNKAAMLAGILNPFVGKNGKSLTSILPHLTRDFPCDDTTEILLRPRLPLLPPLAGAHLFSEEGSALEDEDEEMELDSFQQESVQAHHGNGFDARQLPQDDASAQDTIPNYPRLGMLMDSDMMISASIGDLRTKTSNFEERKNEAQPGVQLIHSPVPFSTARSTEERKNEARPDVQLTHSPVPFSTARSTEGTLTEEKMDDASDSDDESVHLTMQLDTDSESED
ncbi:Transcription factor HMX3 [Hyphodiscus hymeniophilus]|uniref:Pre-rRNA-processing protein RIX1 n=1 Tax=Hyphodiscus hymeniophilus TaxID=353542 RepID=A0A9P7AWR2_9HELO|nr:Transcription factor HMX3 [Hyphodiscus hymeniophilus]